MLFRLELRANILTAYYLENTEQQVGRLGRTTGDMGIHRDDIAYLAEGCIAFAEYAADRSRSRRRQRRFWGSALRISSFQRNLHIDRNRAGDEQHVGKSGRSGEMDAEPLAIVNSVIHGMDFQLAAVARTGIHLPDGQAAVKGLSDLFFQLRADPGDFSLELSTEAAR